MEQDILSWLMRGGHVACKIHSSGWKFLAKLAQAGSRFGKLVSRLKKLSVVMAV